MLFLCLSAIPLFIVPPRLLAKASFDPLIFPYLRHKASETGGEISVRFSDESHTVAVQASADVDDVQPTPHRGGDGNFTLVNKFTNFVGARIPSGPDFGESPQPVLTLHAADLEIFDLPALRRIFSHSRFSALALWGCDGFEDVSEIEKLCRKFDRKLAVFSDRPLENIDKAVWREVRVEQESTSQSEIGNFQLGQCTGVMQEIEECVILPILRPEVFRSVGLTVAPRVLLHGPQRLTHSLISELSEICKQLDITITRVPVSSFLSKYFGDTEKKIYTTFKQVDKGGRTVLVLEDVEILCARRDGNPHADSLGGTINRAVAAFLTCLDGIGGSGNFAVIGTTSADVTALDPALVRAGRLERWIHAASDESHY